MQNRVSDGDVVTFTPPAAGVTSGQGYLIIDMFVVATNTLTAAQVTAGVLGEGVVTGVVDLAKVAGAAWAEGRAVYWDEAEEAATIDDENGANVLIGAVVYPAAASDDTTGRVRLNGCVIPRIDLPVS